jgi:NADPH:quinone reductase-like Zn-dependent oxidoreductase
MSRPDLVRKGLKFMVEHVAAGDLKMRIDWELPLNQAAEAQKLLEDRKVTGAVVLRP